MRSDFTSKLGDAKVKVTIMILVRRRSLNEEHNEIIELEKGEKFDIEERRAGQRGGKNSKTFDDAKADPGNDRQDPQKEIAKRCENSRG